jgi:deazaflavin-dependent oxidoreductase (nitroreductase family)
VIRVALTALAAFAVVYAIVIPVLERIVPRRVLVAYWRAVNPVWSKLARTSPGFGIVETTGRKSGRRHAVPVGGKLEGDTFWFVAPHGRKAHYVLNIEADPRVRVQSRGSWRAGTASFVPYDEAWRKTLAANPANAMFSRIAAKDPLGIRVDLDATGWPSPQQPT